MKKFVPTKPDEVLEDDGVKIARWNRTYKVQNSYRKDGVFVNTAIFNEQSLRRLYNLIGTALSKVDSKKKDLDTLDEIVKEIDSQIF